MNISGDKIKSLRIDHGWSQDRLAKVSGLSLRTIQRIEGGDSCSVESKLSLAATFEVSPQNLCDEQVQTVVADELDMSRLSAFVLVLSTLGCLLWLSGGAKIFFDPISLCTILLLAPSLTILSKGFSNTVNCLLLLRWLYVKPALGTGMANCVRTLHKLILHLYACSAIACLLSLIGLLSQSDITSEHIGNYLAIVILPVLYAAILAELVFRPIKFKAEALICLANEQ